MTLSRPHTGGETSQPLQQHGLTLQQHELTLQQHGLTLQQYGKKQLQHQATRYGLAALFFFFPAPLLVLVYCMFTGKLNRVDNDTSADEEVESSDNVRVETPSNLDVAPGSRLGLVRISEASPYTKETPPPYESIVLPVDSFSPTTMISRCHLLLVPCLCRCLRHLSMVLCRAS